MMKNKSISKNYIYNLCYQLLVVLVPVVTTPYISRVLGAEGIGIYSYTNSIVTYFALFAALGTTVYSRREIAYYQDDTEKRSRIFWEILIFRLGMTIICLGIYMAYICTTTYRMIGIVQGFYIVAVVFDITWFFQGMEEFGKVILRNTVVKLVNVAIIFTFVRTADDLIVYIFSLAFLPLIGNIVTWVYLPKYIVKPNWKKLHPFCHFRGAVSLFVPTIASQVYLILDKTMLGMFTTSSVENGYYEQAQKIIIICWTFVTAFATVMSPRIAYIFAKKDKEQIREYMRNSFRIIWFLSLPIVFGMIAVASNLVPWFFGEGFEKVTGLLVIFSWIVLPVGLSSVIGTQYLVPTKRQRVYTLSVLAGALVNFSMNLVLIPRYYSEGAAVASVTAQVVIVLVQLMYILVYIREIRIHDVLFKAWHYLLAGLLMFAVVLTISRLLVSSWGNTMLLICIGAAVYFLVLFLMRDKLVLDGIKKLSKLWSRKVRLKDEF